MLSFLLFCVYIIVLVSPPHLIDDGKFLQGKIQFLVTLHLMQCGSIQGSLFVLPSPRDCSKSLK